ncbi:hypothetical protein [Paenibacillus algorifonticola]|uniref:hypothetical protein n=1 Tax=Paenibacillus algorifonticola TaxID=684063 RepID=UPI000619410D|nr:hypothetical protein [Paenibacillus algorifonticola]
MDTLNYWLTFFSCASTEKTADSNNRYFGTEHGSEMKLSPTGVEFTGGSKEPLFLKLDDAVHYLEQSAQTDADSEGRDVAVHAETGGHWRASVTSSKEDKCAERDHAGRRV